MSSFRIGSVLASSNFVGEVNSNDSQGTNASMTNLPAKSNILYSNPHFGDLVGVLQLFM